MMFSILLRSWYKNLKIQYYCSKTTKNQEFEADNYQKLYFSKIYFFAISSSFKVLRKILPTLVFGNSVRNSICFGHL